MTFMTFMTFFQKVSIRNFYKGIFRTKVIIVIILMARAQSRCQGV